MAGKALPSPTSCLLMIVYSSPGGMKEVLMLSTQHYTPIAMDLGRK
jgi:hypothetical protein